MQMSLLQNRLTDIESKFMVAKGERGWEGPIWSLGLTDTQHYI